MNEAVFISDLHLHPNQPEITQRFLHFLEWAKTNTQSVYILGDFFHVWVGDDLMGEYELNIAKQLLDLARMGIRTYFMPGNRDFLLGEGFLNLAGMTYLPDPSVVCLKGLRLFLTHGDAYCLHDRGHQWLRRITRPILLKKTFLAFPKSIRAKIVSKVRGYSQQKKSLKSINHKKYLIVQSKLFAQMHKHQVMTVIYGHIHKPGEHQTQWNNRLMHEFVLSDWDQAPQIICYDVHHGLRMQQFGF